MLSSHEDTIAAIITPIGEGGIAVIRLSGKNAISVASGFFRGSRELTSVSTHTAHVGFFTNMNGDAVDEVVVTVFRSPNSYTTEDCVEISCHGSVFIAKKILDHCLKAGTRLAEPGEFTKRAFLNGRIDLSQAEAVAELIHSHSDAAHRASLNQLRGMHSNTFSDISKELLDLCSLLELDLDFTEDNLSVIETSTSIKKLEKINLLITQLIDSYEFGKIYRDGFRVVIVGKPNSGKSSLLNVLLNQDRSIVTDISGTTRDTIEESINISGLKFTVVDTAGLRTTNDIVESEGIKRTYDEIAKANLIVYLVDASNETDLNKEKTFAELISNLNIQHTKVIIIFNKIDLLDLVGRSSLPEKFMSYKTLKLSTKTYIGVNDIRDYISSVAQPEKDSYFNEKITITNARHFNKLQRVGVDIQRALTGLRSNLSNEFIVVDIRNALKTIGEITGKVTSEDILNNIFSGFCIGK